MKDILADKHPPGAPANPNSIINTNPQPFHPAIYNELDAKCIRSAALHTEGAAGPSGVDARGWRKMCCSFASTSGDLCRALAATARRLSTSLIDPKSLSALLACRLIALSKDPGVRPIGVGETVRRILAKAILSITKCDVQEVAGTTQLCAGQLSGIEAAVHAMRSLFEENQSEAALLVDATNAFNSLNRQVALQNIQHLCPPLSNILINTYREPSQLFMDGDVILSKEGTTQGDPLAMPMYALATIPLIKRLHQGVHQTWYADDAAGIGRLVQLRKWWDDISALGPSYGYFSNPAKTWLVTKEEHYKLAVDLFSGTGIRITTEGRPYLGVPLGTLKFTTEWLQSKVKGWCDEIETLAKIAGTQPHAAYSAFTHGFASKWSYISRTVPGCAQLLLPVESAIRSKLLPALTGRPPFSDDERALLALPARLGGMGILDPVQMSPIEYHASLKVTQPLTEAILQKSADYSFDVWAEQLSAKTQVASTKKDFHNKAATNLKGRLTEPLQRAMDLAQQKGSSSWLTTLPLDEHGFDLHKGAFWDAIALRYNWPLMHLPSKCACSANLSVEHALSCPKGGFPTIRHNEIRDFTANLLTEICSNVCVEPELQPLSGESLTNKTANTDDNARLDIAANGLWGGRYERTFVDVRIFNPYASTHRNVPTSTCYKSHERMKKRAYEQRVREIEHATFTPLVFSATGGMANEAGNFYKRIAFRLATKWDQPYSCTMAWLRCRLTFSLLRSAIQCFRGARSSAGHAGKQLAPVDLVIAETEMRLDD